MNEAAKWIWKKDFEGWDLFCDFFRAFDYHGGTVTLRLSADSNYALFINGQLVESGQYADYPHYKVYDELDITPFCKEGANCLAVTVWYYGRPALTYYPGTPALRFEILCEGSLLACSDGATLCRQSREYESGRCKLICGHLGYSYHYDITANDGWKTGDLTGFEPSAVVDQDLPMHRRPIQKLVWKPLAPPRFSKAKAAPIFSTIWGRRRPATWR